jgi:hypothetical protein
MSFLHKFNYYQRVNELSTKRKIQRQEEHRFDTDSSPNSLFTMKKICGESFALKFILYRNEIHRTLSDKVDNANWTNKCDVAEEYINNIDLLNKQLLASIYSQGKCIFPTISPSLQ